MSKVVVRTHRPELTPEERNKRMKLIKEAAARLIQDLDERRK